MLSIKQKLYELERQSAGGKQVVEIEKNELVDSLPYKKLEQLSCTLVYRNHQSYVLREKRYALQFEHGGFPLKHFATISAKDFAYLAADENYVNLTPEDYLFIDTETTGLAGGTGTFIFLIGIGFLTGNEFIVRQYLMPDFAVEASVLQDILKIISNFSGFISYNGKSYDIPLLKTRLILNRLDAKQFDNMQHVDLLHCSRRLWKKFTKCDLQSIERKVLGFTRKNDVPGEDIPAIFFKFIKDKDLSPLAPVLRHNVIDLLSMVSIISQAIVTIRGGTALSLYDARAIFHLLDRVGETEQALQSTLLPQENCDLQLLFEKSMVLKRLGKMTEAVPIWQRIIQEKSNFEPAYVELAKYFEHIEKDYQKALSFIERAKRSKEIATTLFPEKEVSFTEDWNHRQKRVQKKLSLHACRT